MTIHPDDALFSFQKLRLWGGNLSEADTRGKIIDEILKNVLSWSESDITRETRVDGGYIDYVLTLDGSPLIVVEAKKSGLYFEIPPNFKNRKYKINASISKVALLRERAQLL